ncbi:hypothetical protein BC829DRAFT_6022 [Chytridium lagenaria]|nr:hypothetical protein BC829DRAFT_6022 [Chytridium lagenaria]
MSDRKSKNEFNSFHSLSFPPHQENILFHHFFFLLLSATAVTCGLFPAAAPPLPAAFQSDPAFTPPPPAAAGLTASACAALCDGRPDISAPVIASPPVAPGCAVGDPSTPIVEFRSGVAETAPPAPVPSRAWSPPEADVAPVFTGSTGLEPRPCWAVLAPGGKPLVDPGVLE